jgi:hypothetical protein
MSTHNVVERDERTLAVENSGYGWAYGLLTYALLIDVMYRSFVWREAAWDLMALVIGGSAFCAIYQARHKALVRGWFAKAALVACVAAVIAAIVAFANGR